MASSFTSFIPADEMIRFVCMFTPDFWPGFATLVQSIAENGQLSAKEYEFSVICEIDQAPRGWLDSRPEAISLIPSSAIPNIPILSPFAQGKRMEESLQKLGLFALPDEGVTRVCIDSDMVCLGSLRELLQARPITGACDEFCGFDTGKSAGDMEDVQINGGLIVFSPSLRAFSELTAVYERRHGEGCFKADQDVINMWLEETGQKPHRLTSEWNFSKRFQNGMGLRWVKAHINEVRILHFVGVKPWTSNSEISTIRECRYRWLEEIWWDYFERSGFAAHMQTPLCRSTAWIRQWVLPWTKTAILKEHVGRIACLLQKAIFSRSKRNNKRMER
jgi:hypothetical protein